MTTGDYVLWFGALLFLLFVSGMFVNWTKLAVDNVREWGGAVFAGSMVLLGTYILVLSFTYQLVVN